MKQSVAADTVDMHDTHCPEQIFLKFNVQDPSNSPCMLQLWSLFYAQCKWCVVSQEMGLIEANYCGWMRRLWWVKQVYIVLHFWTTLIALGWTNLTICGRNGSLFYPKVYFLYCIPLYVLCSTIQNEKKRKSDFNLLYFIISYTW